MARSAPTNRALRWVDIPREGQKRVEEHVREKGVDLPNRLRAAVAVVRAKQAAGTASPGKIRDADSLERVAPQVKSKPITLRGAANSRKGLYKEAVARSDSSGPEGAGWYYNHHADILKEARSTGFDIDRAVTASAVMSPNNNPDNEKAAVTALMHAHGGNHTVNISPEVAAKVAKTTKGKTVIPAHQIGRDVSVHNLASDVLGHLSNPEIRDHVQHSGIDFDSIARGGTKENIGKAVDVLRGRQETATAIDPATSPKVHTYRGNILKAVPGSAEHVEYMSRVLHHADVMTGRQHEGQQMLDTHGLRNSSEGMLDHKGPTTEDTWQHAVSTQQPLEGGAAKRTVPLTTVSTVGGKGTPRIHPDRSVTASGLNHAYNGEATTRATASMNNEAAERGLDFKLPNVATQEVVWTRGRQLAGEDAEFNNREARNAPMSSSEEANNAVRSINKAKAKAAGLPAPRLNRQQFKEEGLF